MKFLAFTFFALVTASSFAADGSSGCGPGWYIFKENSLVSSALRVTTNGFLFPSVTFGMTSGTSNCTKHKLVLKEKESLHFVTENFYELQSDAARGQGMYLTTLMQTIGCGKDVQKIFLDESKRNFTKIFKEHATPAEALEATYIMILEDQSMVRSCSLG